MTTTDWAGECSPLEARAEVDSLDDLHHRRRALLPSWAPLHARFGPWGSWDAKRKQLLEALKVRHRAQLQAQGVKSTEAMIDALAHADEQYEAFLDAAERDRVEYLVLDNEKSEIEERIRSREIGLLAYNSEVKLTR